MQRNGSIVGLPCSPANRPVAAKVAQHRPLPLPKWQRQTDPADDRPRAGLRRLVGEKAEINPVQPIRPVLARHLLSRWEPV
jgi:hypothetical protein